MKVAIFCGSKTGNNSVYKEATQQLGKYFAAHKIDIVFGGGHVGLMGIIADSVLENGGKAYGVIPHHLESKEIAHKYLTELTVVSGMHERKAAMSEMSDAFIALPGGAGTLEEIFEAWTWAQLGYHHKPCAFFNVQGFYDPLFDMIQQMVKQGFLNSDYANMLIKTDSPQALVEQIQIYQPPL
ncbi:MAG: TIGR00730 family Rossman fold protein [Reinekea sp.]